MALTWKDPRATLPPRRRAQTPGPCKVSLFVNISYLFVYFWTPVIH